MMQAARMFRLAVAVAFTTALLGGISSAQDEKLDQQYQAFGVGMGSGISGVLEIRINRYSTEEERAALITSLKENGQEKTVEMLRKQPEIGFARTQGGGGMAGFPSVRIHYAHQAEQDGKRVVVLATDRTMRIGEVANQTRSSEYDIAVIVMELAPDPSDSKLVEKGTGLYYAAVKMEFVDDKLKAEYMGTQPVRLTDIRRSK